MNTKIFATFFNLTIAFNSLAGGVSHGGGDALICQERPVHKQSLLKLGDSERIERTYLADTYAYLKGHDSTHFIMLEGLKFEILYETFIEHLNLLNPGEGTRVDRAAETLKFDFVGHDLQELEDDNLKVPKNCYKKQLAIQDLGSSGVVQVNQLLYGKLSNLEKVLFKIHEAYIRIYNGPADTTFLRAIVRSALDKKSSLHNLADRKTTEKLSQWEFYQYAFARTHLRVFQSWYLPRVSHSNGYIFREPINMSPEDSNHETVARLLEKMKKDKISANWYNNSLHPQSNQLTEKMLSFWKDLSAYYKASSKCPTAPNFGSNIYLIPLHRESPYVHQIASRLGATLCGSNAPVPEELDLPL